jgi:4-hydroxy-4-methyl-2-oxoglutarate aldolase
MLRFAISNAILARTIHHEDPVITPADVMQTQSGVAVPIVGPQPIAPTSALCAPAFTCACAPGDNLALHHALMRAPAGAVIVCVVGDHSTAYIGDLMSTDAMQRGLAGLVIDGPVRDAPAVVELGWPVFHVGLNPASPAKASPGLLGAPVTIGGARVETGDQIVADRDGVLVVPRALWESVAASAHRVRDREDAIRAALASGTRLAELMEIPEPPA